MDHEPLLTPAGAAVAALADAPQAAGAQPARIRTLLSVFVAGHPVSQNAMYRPKRRGKHNHQHVSGKTGQLYLTQAARDWEESVAYSVMRWRFSEREAAAHPKLQVAFTFYGVRADVDNLCKATIDGIKQGLLIDDRHIQSITASRGEPASYPDLRYSQGAQITVWLI